MMIAKSLPETTPASSGCLELEAQLCAAVST
jgi:hypothetical protein